MRNPWIFFVVLSVHVHAQTDAQLKSKIDSIILNAMPKDKAVGVSIGVVKNGKIFYTKGYGTKELNTNNPIDSLTNFHLASISKVFVATAIMQLAEQGKLSLEDKLLKYIPISELKDQRFKGITIKQMLTHTSGFPDVEDYHWNKPKNDSAALGNYSKKCIQTEKLKFDPGTSWDYSNMAFECLGYVIEVITKRSFDSYEKENVLLKAGMILSNFDYHKIDPNRRSVGHTQTRKGVKTCKTYPYNREHGPSSTLNSNAYDMCKWMEEILNIHADKNYKGLIKNETLNEMWSKKFLFDSQAVHQGLAWIGQYSPLGMCMMHSGSDEGFQSNMFLYPEYKMGIIILTNGDHVEGSVMMRAPGNISLLLKDK
jgi:CubicO group peptidase (beta-lactamase class C family)